MKINWIIALIFALLGDLLFLILLSSASSTIQEKSAAATVCLAIAAFPIMIALTLEKAAEVKIEPTTMKKIIWGIAFIFATWALYLLVFSLRSASSEMEGAAILLGIAAYLVIGPFILLKIQE